VPLVQQNSAFKSCLWEFITSRPLLQSCCSSGKYCIICSLLSTAGIEFETAWEKGSFFCSRN
jgi:hypothetical protein